MLYNVGGGVLSLSDQQSNTECRITLIKQTVLAFSEKVICISALSSLCGVIYLLKFV